MPEIRYYVQVKWLIQLRFRSKQLLLTISYVFRRLSAPSKVTLCVYCDSHLAMHHKSYIMNTQLKAWGETCPVLLVILDTECRLGKGYMEMFCNRTHKDKPNMSHYFLFFLRISGPVSTSSTQTKSGLLCISEHIKWELAILQNRGKICTKKNNTFIMCILGGCFLIFLSTCM